MPCQFETNCADDWDRRFSEFKQTVIRRIGGDSSRTEEVEASVDFDENLSTKTAVNRGGLTDGINGQYIDEEAQLHISSDQDFSMEDTWVIDGKVFKTRGDSIGRDAAVTTLDIARRITKRAREPRTSR